MIYTMTLNPALDYALFMPSYQDGAVNRAERVVLLPGGKGVNVSLMLGNLGVSSVALGFAAGFTGEELQRLLAERECVSDFVFLKEGSTRINVKLKAEAETEINASGPQVSKEDLAELYKKLGKLQKGDYLVLAGSVPGGLSNTLYRDMMHFLKDVGVEILVDAEGDLLLEALPYRPFLIKPNQHELGAMFGVKIRTHQEAIAYAKRLQEKGARNILVSMAGDGAVLVAEDGQCFLAQAPRGTVINATGAGDSMVAGFLAGFLKEKDFQTAFLYGLAAGSATAFCEDLAEGEIIETVRAAAEKEQLIQKVIV